MSCAMRSMMTRYPLGSAIFTPPSFTKSAETSSTFRLLIRSTNAGGNVFSIPNITPIFFVLTKPHFLTVFKICHPERSAASLREAATQSKDPFNLSCPSQDRPAPQISRSILPPSSPTTANHARYDLPKHPASAAQPSHEAYSTISHSHPGTCPTHPRPVQS